MQHRVVGIHDGKLDLASEGIKCCMQPEMKLALSGLLNPREGVVSLFCSSSCASYHCHTSDSKLIELKMQEIKRKAAPAFLSVYAEAKRQTNKKKLSQSR